MQETVESAGALGARIPKAPSHTASPIELGSSGNRQVFLDGLTPNRLQTLGV